MKDRRYNTVGKLIRANEIKTFDEILDTIPKTRLALDLGINPERMNRLLANVELFVIKDLFALAELLEVDTISILHLVNNQYAQDRKSKKRK
jgi:hypothetical protein